MGTGRALPPQPHWPSRRPVDPPEKTTLTLICHCHRLSPSGSRGQRRGSWGPGLLPAPWGAQPQAPHVSLCPSVPLEEPLAPSPSVSPAQPALRDVSMCVYPLSPPRRSPTGLRATPGVWDRTGEREEGGTFQSIRVLHTLGGPSLLAATQWLQVEGDEEVGVSHAVPAAGRAQGEGGEALPWACRSAPWERSAAPGHLSPGGSLKCTAVVRGHRGLMTRAVTETPGDSASNRVEALDMSRWLRLNPAGAQLPLSCQRGGSQCEGAPYIITMEMPIGA